MYILDESVISLPNFIRVSSSCSIVGNYYANPNYPWTVTHQEWMGGWKLGNGEEIECREKMSCQQAVCMNDIRNLISNSDFSNALDSWIPNDLTKVSVTASDFNLGSQSMKISGYGFSNQKPNNLINQAGKEFSLSVWLKKDPNTISRIIVTSEDGQTLFYKEIREEITGWRKYEYKFTIPDNQQYQITLDTYPNNIGDVWYDDVRLIEVIQPLLSPDEDATRFITKLNEQKEQKTESQTKSADLLKKSEGTRENTNEKLINFIIWIIIIIAAIFILATIKATKLKRKRINKHKSK